MADISLTASMRSNLLSLQQTQADAELDGYHSGKTFHR